MKKHKNEKSSHDVLFNLKNSSYKTKRVFYSLVAFYSILNALLVMFFTILMFFLLYQKNNLVLIISIFGFGFVSNSFSFIFLLKSVENKMKLDINNTRKLYIEGVVSATIILILVGYFIAPRDLLFLFFMPLIGIVITRPISHFYAKKQKPNRQS